MPESTELLSILAETEHCNKCGFCLPACPTYRLTGQELHSPRGRIAMVEAAARNELPNWSGLEEALSYCIGCRACEPACPSGVHYESILEAGRTALIARGSHAFRGSLASRGALYLSKHRHAFGQLAELGRHFRHIVPDIGVGRDLVAMLPGPVAPESLSNPAWPKPPQSAGRVAFFASCVMESVFGEANRAAKNLLQAAGFTVETVSDETCCGAIHLHSGERSSAQEMARHNIFAFERGQWDYIVNTAGGCGAMLQEYPDLLAGEPSWQDRALRFSQRVRDFSTLLLDERATPLAYQGDHSRVTLQNSCHLANVQRIAPHPFQLLAQVEGDLVLTFKDQEMCCGSGGLYNINHREWAQAILDDKMGKLEAVEPNRILVNNPGCHLQMQAGVTRHEGLDASVEHLATYLWRCYLRAQGPKTRIPE